MPRQQIPAVRFSVEMRGIGVVDSGTRGDRSIGSGDGALLRWAQRRGPDDVGWEYRCVKAAAAFMGHGGLGWVEGTTHNRADAVVSVRRRLYSREAAHHLATCGLTCQHALTTRSRSPPGCKIVYPNGARIGH